MNYMDDPKGVEEWIERLTPSEEEVFNKGYLLALLNILEEIYDSKAKIMLEIMHLEDKSSKRDLASRVHILDVYELLISKRVKTLTQEYA